jgi:hypothetical protein
VGSGEKKAGGRGGRGRKDDERGKMMGWGDFLVAQRSLGSGWVEISASIASKAAIFSVFVSLYFYLLSSDS